MAVSKGPVVQMPFIALRSDQKVTPEEVEDDEVVKCPSCKKPMKPRRSHYRRKNGDKFFVARHFWHHERGEGSCTGGESLTHQKMKSVALSKLKRQFECSASGLEKKIGENKADAYIAFAEPVLPFGKGMAVEAQYKHRSKDKESTIENYFDHGYSVCWLEEDDFSGKDVSLKENIMPTWPARAPDHRWENGKDISNYGSEGHLFMNVLDEVPQPRVPPEGRWRGKPIDVSKFAAEGKVRGKFWMSWCPWPMRIPPATEWGNRRVELPGNDDWRGLELKFRISEADESIRQELVIKEILVNSGPSQITEIWPRFAHRANTRGMGVKDLVNKLESMPSIRRIRGRKWRYAGHH